MGKYWNLLMEAIRTVKKKVLSLLKKIRSNTTKSINKYWHSFSLLSHKNSSLAASNKLDVLLFSTINLSFRKQRPQHLALELAKAGYRVFYFGVDLNKTSNLLIKKVSTNIYRCTLPFSKEITVNNADLGKNKNMLHNTLNKFYSSFYINEAIALVQLPRWLPVAEYLKDNFNTRIAELYDAESDTSLIQAYNITNIFKSIYPLVSIIIVTFNNLKYTKLCLESIFAKTAYPNFEIIVIDNASSDDTVDYVNNLALTHGNINIIVNKENKGFVAANNIGIQKATGELIILLNNDTIVTPGWISGLIKYLNDPTVGMVGPVTNSIGNEAKINITYSELSDIDKFSINYTAKHKNEAFPIKVLAMFCVALRRTTIEKVGYLDERYKVGMFEDDDYAMSLRKAGLELLCAEDVFIHHFWGTSFKKMESESFQKIADKNREKFEKKWGVKWEAHKQRPGIVSSNS